MKQISCVELGLGERQDTLLDVFDYMSMHETTKPEEAEIVPRM